MARINVMVVIQYVPLPVIYIFKNTNLLRINNTYFWYLFLSFQKY